MIPKIIHYCWFGRSPLPPLAKECIASWKKYLPEYEIKEWNEDNFDVNMIPYTRDAYKVKKYAFVSDYARYYILYHEGGIYFDTDVEVIKSLDDILANGSFMGFEESPGFFVKGQVNPGLGLACEKNMPFVKMMLDWYEQQTFIDNLSHLFNNNICTYTTEMFYRNGMLRKSGIQTSNGFWLYPPCFFSPINFVTKKLHITHETRTIHRYMASWANSKQKSIVSYIWHYSPEWILIMQNRVRRFKEWKIFS